MLAFYDDYGRGMDGMQLPYEAHCFRAVVVESRAPRTESVPEDADREGDGVGEDDTDGVSDGTDTDMLLIDFR